MPFSDIGGHRVLVQLISRAVDRASLPPSLLFAGPEGVGKRLTATALAQALNCADPARRGLPVARRPPPEPLSPLDACGRCSARTRIARGVHPDVLAVEAGGQRGHQPSMRYGVRSAKPATGPSRDGAGVIVIDTADRLVPQSAERAAQDPRGTAGCVAVRAGHGASRHAARHGAVALPAPELRAAGAGGGDRRPDARPRLRRADRRGVGGVRRGQHRPRPAAGCRGSWPRRGPRRWRCCRPSPGAPTRGRAWPAPRRCWRAGAAARGVARASARS